MPDTPDYSKYQLGSVRFSIQDLGEIAVRLGALSKYYRSGLTFFYDDFSYGLVRWTTPSAGAGSGVSLSTYPGLSFAYIADLMCGVGAGASAGIQMDYAPFSLTRTGYEFSFSCLEDLNYITLDMYHASIDHADYPLLRFNNITKQIQVLDQNSVYQNVGAMIFDPAGDGVGHFCKVVVDFVTKQYVRLLLDDIEYDLSGIYFRSILVTTLALSRILINVGGKTGYNSRIVVGHVIMTNDEP